MRRHRHYRHSILRNKFPVQYYRRNLDSPAYETGEIPLPKPKALPFEEAIKVAQKEAPLFQWPSGEPQGIRAGWQYFGQKHGGRTMPPEDKLAIQKWKDEHRLPPGPHLLPGKKPRDGFSWGEYLGVIPDLPYKEAREFTQKHARHFRWPSGEPQGIRAGWQYFGQKHGRRTMPPEDKLAIKKWKNEHRLPLQPYLLHGGKPRLGFSWPNFLGRSKKLATRHYRYRRNLDSPAYEEEVPKSKECTDEECVGGRSGRSLNNKKYFLLVKHMRSGLPLVKRGSRLRAVVRGRKVVVQGKESVDVGIQDQQYGWQNQVCGII